jgi:regulatory protein YycI of two-component signal transduction system YycFG
MIFLGIYIFLVMYYFFRVMKKERDELAEKIVKEVDAHNLEILKELSERKIAPLEYNKQIKNYKREVSNVLLSRGLTYPLSWILKLFKKLLYKNK